MAATSIAPGLLFAQAHQRFSSFSGFMNGGGIGIGIGRNAASNQCFEMRQCVSRATADAQSSKSTSLFASSISNDEFEKEELNEDTDSFAYLVNTVQCILHFKYRVGHYLDEYDTKLIQDEVLRFHPRAAEKIGCGVGSIMVTFHPEYNRSRCFMIHRLDDSLCDFSYRKSMLERARLKGINTMTARKLLNMDYFNLAQNQNAEQSSTYRNNAE